MDRYCIAELKYSEEEKLTIERVLDPKKLAPVIHGHWVWDAADVYHCSYCGSTFQLPFEDHIERYKFCPFCPAILDEEVETDE